MPKKEPRAKKMDGIFCIVVFSGLVGGMLLWEWKASPETFLQTIRSTVVGIATGVLVTLLVVNSVIEHREQKKWKTVRNTTYSQLINQICHISASCTGFYRIGIRDKWELVNGTFPPNNKTLSAFDGLIRDLNKHNINGNIPITYNVKGHDAEEKFYEDVKYNLDHIQMVLIPRVIQGHGEQELIDALVMFESAGNKLGDEVLLNHTCFPAVVSLIEKGRIVYETIYNNWNE